MGRFAALAPVCRGLLSRLPALRDAHNDARARQAGLVDFAVFDAQTSARLVLQRSGRVLSKDSPSPNPLALIANYFFDWCVTGSAPRQADCTAL